MDLSEDAKAQVGRFMGFFKGKRDLAIADAVAGKDEFVSDRLADDSAIYNSSDVKALLSALSDQLIASLKQEHETIVGTSAVYVSQLLIQAEKAGTKVDVPDISIIEDRKNISQVSSLAGVKYSLAPPKRGLDAIGSTGSDPKVLQELLDVKEENRQMHDRQRSLQTEMSTLLKERSTLTAELEKVKENFKQMRARSTGDNSVNAAAIERSLNETKAMLDSKASECDTMKKDLDKRLGESSQFKELKSILQKKTDEVKDLKKRLAKAGVDVPSTDGGVDLEPDDD